MIYHLLCKIARQTGFPFLWTNNSTPLLRYAANYFCRRRLVYIGLSLLKNQSRFYKYDISTRLILFSFDWFDIWSIFKTIGRSSVEVYSDGWERWRKRKPSRNFNQRSRHFKGSWHRSSKRRNLYSNRATRKTCKWRTGNGFRMPPSSRVIGRFFIHSHLIKKIQ